MQRAPDHPVPLGCRDPDYLGDGAYVSHDGVQTWVSCERDDGLHAVALDGPSIDRLVQYAKRIGVL